MEAALLEKHIGELASGFHLGFAGSKIQEASNPCSLSEQLKEDTLHMSNL